MSRYRQSARFWLLLLTACPCQADEPARERFTITHTTTYVYDRPVTLLPHTVRLTPQAWAMGTIQNGRMRIQTDGTHTLERQADLENNLVMGVQFAGATKLLTIENRFTLEFQQGAMRKIHPDDHARVFPIAYQDAERKRLAVYLVGSGGLGKRFRDFVDALPLRDDSSVEWLASTNKRICDKVTYMERREVGVRSPDDTLKDGGSCRDFAWLGVQVLRQRGVAARFVSGYQVPNAALTNPRAKKHKAELHAWVEAYVPGAGWVGLDPTAGKWVTGAYVPVAGSATVEHAGPLLGSFKSEPAATSQLRYEIEVERR